MSQRVRRGRSTCVLALLAAFALHAPTLRASCKEALPDPRLRELDLLASVDPVRAIASARGLLAEPGRDAWSQAQLHAIIADAFDTTGDDEQAQAAVAAGRALLSTAVPSATLEVVQLRFALVQADTAQSREELEAAIRDITAWEPRAERQALGRACLLLVRSRAYGRLQQHERAAEDGLRAHQIAVEIKAGDAIAESSFQLATTFRRAGLYEQALAFADESIAQARSDARGADLAAATYVKAQIYADSGQPAMALSSAQESRRLSVELDDEIGRAFADHVACDSLLDLGRIDEGAAACQAARAVFDRVGRQDQVTGAVMQLSRIQVARGQFTEALTALDRLLARDGRDIPPTYMARIYMVHADVLTRLGRTSEAARSLQRSLDLNAQADERRRSVAAALLLAQREIERRERDRQTLSQQLLAEREQARNRELTRRLSFVVAIGSVLLVALLAWLLAVARRRARELRRQEVVLRTLSEHSPDALLLVDRAGRVQFASRPPFGQDVGVVRGRPLADIVPDSMRGQVTEALERLLGSGAAFELDVSLPTEAGQRDYEIRGLPVVENGQLIGATLRCSDATAHRSTERAVFDAVHRDRERASGDLHEGLGQELTGIALQLRAAANAIRRGEVRVAQDVDDAVDQLHYAIDTTRSVAKELSPVQIRRGSLSGALESLCADHERRLGAAVRSRSDPAEIALPASVADHLYRIADEAIANASMVQQLSRVDVELTEHAAGVTLRVSDDGVRSESGAVGAEDERLRVMSYRAHLLGGSLRIETAQGQTRVIVTIPRPPAV